jgi:uncharacterized protein YciI
MDVHVRTSDGTRLPAVGRAAPQSAGVAEWIAFLHAPREDFAATMTDAERAAWGEHFERLQRLVAEGVVVMAGPTLGPDNTGILVFEADDLEAAERLVAEDPTASGGFVTPEIRPFRISLLRGRD